MLMSPDPISGKPLSLAQACARLRCRHLQFLDILGQARNLRLTAEQMHITQPAATKILMDIEEILEARLFDRLSRGMRPNELGLFTLRYAASALIASVAEIQRLRPLLVLKVLEQSSDQLVVWLAERKIDLMIGRFTEESQRSQFHYERLSDESLQVVGGLHHPLRGARELDMAELSHWPWILYPTSTALRKVSDDIFGRNGLALTSGVVETPSFLFALEMMQTTDMLSLQPTALVKRYIDKGLLARIPVDLPDRMPDYGMLTRLGETPTPATLAFMEVLRGVAAA